MNLPKQDQFDVLYDRRQKNLRLLIKLKGTPEIVEAMNYNNASYLSAMVGKSASRKVSEKTARSLESKLYLPIGWLDEEHNDQPDKVKGTNSADKLMSFTDAITYVANQFKTEMPNIKSSAKFGELCALIYEQYQNNSLVEVEYIHRLVRFALL